MCDLGNIASDKISMEVLEAWVRLNRGPALAYAYSLVRNHHTAEDMVQDCMCRLIEKKDRYDLIADGRKLLFRSITNACINFTTRLRLVTGLDEDEGWQKSLMDVREAAPESKALGKEMEQKIEEGLLLLTFEQRSAIQLKVVGATTEEIAKALKITNNHAGVLVHRARQSLAKHLAPVMEEQIV